MEAPYVEAGSADAPTIAPPPNVIYGAIGREVMFLIFYLLSLIKRYYANLMFPMSDVFN